MWECMDLVLAVPVLLRPLGGGRSREMIRRIVGRIFSVTVILDSV